MVYSQHLADIVAHSGTAGTCSSLPSLAQQETVPPSPQPTGVSAPKCGCGVSTLSLLRSYTAFPTRGHFFNLVKPGPCAEKGPKRSQGLRTQSRGAFVFIHPTEDRRRHRGGVGWGDGSVANSTDCSSKRPELGPSTSIVAHNT